MDTTTTSVDAASERRNEAAHNGLLRTATLAAAGIAVATPRRPAPCRGGDQSPTLTFNDIPGTGDIKVLNYALALETLEADLYAQAVNRLAAIGASSASQQYVQKFAQVEADHRDFLKNALGSAGITASGQPLAGATFDFGITTMSEAGIINLIYTIEDTGTKAYLGAIPFFATKTYLAVAGGIQATEARHTATVAILLRSLGGTTDLNGSPVETAPLSNNNNGIDPITLDPTTVLGKVSGPNGFILLP